MGSNGRTAQHNGVSVDLCGECICDLAVATCEECGDGWFTQDNMHKRVCKECFSGNTIDYNLNYDIRNYLLSKLQCESIKGSLCDEYDIAARVFMDEASEQAVWEAKAALANLRPSLAKLDDIGPKLSSLRRRLESLRKLQETGGGVYFTQVFGEQFGLKLDDATVSGIVKDGLDSVLKEFDRLTKELLGEKDVEPVGASDNR
jgi:hypothetical protein